MDPTRMFNITSQPQPELNDRIFSVGIGCVVGGSSSVNGQVFLRGTKEELDSWAELGGEGSTWDWEGVLPYFKKVFFGLGRSVSLCWSLLTRFRELPYPRPMPPRLRSLRLLTMRNTGVRMLKSMAPLGKEICKGLSVRKP